MNLLPLRDATFTLDQLVETLERLLGKHLPPPEDERVAPTPDARTLRYYQSLGLLDRPLRYEGRSALYGYRHLLQAVCVKLLQVRGFSLGQAQQALQGATDAALESAALEGLGAPVAPPPPSARPLIAAELAPGIGVWIDPSRVDDPERVLALLARALATPAKPTE